jgi:alkylation response protein AidB-like acyl-CoA dehydrogenase
VDLKGLRLLVDDSLQSDDPSEKRVAQCVDRLMAMREAVSLEASLQEAELPAALLLAGENALEAALDIMSMFWGRREGE